MPPHEVAQAERLHDLAEEADRLLVLEGVVEGHGPPMKFGGVKVVPFG